MPDLKADAAYSVITRPDGGYGVLVTVEGTCPTTVSSFATEEDAEAWIDSHKVRVRAAAERPRSRGRPSSAGSRPPPREEPASV